MNWDRWSLLAKFLGERERSLLKYQSWVSAPSRVKLSVRPASSALEALEAGIDPGLELWVLQF
jgi:hypothetical protein